ncbi:hypothetical protein FZEAL_1181 [Fusarium zealandicum]|uniref:Guanine deaminase n=1 Tax=Fusarium zealandicum TaxID=1053134 RepID=A0A8H4XQ77_9HYPO|nr:hypothetical protein FZEAL_1181 [Fusarium zealandicum]
MSTAGSAFYGTVIHSTSLTSITILQNTLITISSSGRILTVQPEISPKDLDSLEVPLTKLFPHQFLIPGFVDTHNHAPQWMQRGLGQGMHILDWLSGVTFPNEARFKDVEYARRVYASLVEGMLRQGVTTASYYGSLHGDATCILADTCLVKGQRAFVGKCNMNRNSPDYYRDASTDESLQETQRCIRHVRDIDPRGDLVRYVITPRFAISCEPDLLQGLGTIASQNPDLPIQTHFNEAQQEIDATLSLFPDFVSEADLYAHYNLLTPRSILAHCTIMTAPETEKLHAHGCGVAHCPTANMTVGGGFMTAPIRDFLRRGIKVGLGTDSGGGFSSSILDSMRHALIASFAKEAATEGADGGLSLDEVFYLATVGGARVMGLGDEIGNFEVGKQFDGVVVDMHYSRWGVNAPVEEEDSMRRVFDKFLMTGDDRNIVQVFVKGRKVHSIEL